MWLYRTHKSYYNAGFLEKIFFIWSFLFDGWSFRNVEFEYDKLLRSFKDDHGCGI